MGPALTQPARLDDPDAFEMLRGTVSLPFRAGPEQRIAVKVIDFRGNEAIRILDLPTA